MRQTHFRRDITALVLYLISSTSVAWAQASVTPQSEIRDTGISGLWVLANVSYAGMRAQNNPSVLWRTLAFIFGLPGTIVTFFALTREVTARTASICREGEGRRVPRLPQSPCLAINPPNRESSAEGEGTRQFCNCERLTAIQRLLTRPGKGCQPRRC